jgi:hypothetical protein
MCEKENGSATESVAFTETVLPRWFTTASERDGERTHAAWHIICCRCKGGH